MPDIQDGIRKLMGDLKAPDTTRPPKPETVPVSDKARILYMQHAPQLAALRAAADHFERTIVEAMAEVDGLDQEGRTLVFNRDAFTWQIQP